MTGRNVLFPRLDQLPRKPVVRVRVRVRVRVGTRARAIGLDLPRRPSLLEVEGEKAQCPAERCWLIVKDRTFGLDRVRVSVGLVVVLGLGLVLTLLVLVLGLGIGLE